MKLENIEICGFCGRYFIKDKHLTNQDLEGLDVEELRDVPLGYCPDANEENEEQNPTRRNRVSRDMAIDAGDLSLEGQEY